MFAYHILGVKPTACDAEIKTAYMTLSERFSPDRHPEHFKRIRSAYETIKTDNARHRYTLFHQENITYPELVGTLLSTNAAPQIEQQFFHEYFRDCLK